MVRSGWRMRVGGRLAASIGAGIGVVALASGITSDVAAAKSRRDGGKRDEVVLSRPPGTPVMIVVSLNQQRLTVYDAEGPMLQSPVSSGKPGYDTPAGIYTVLERKVEHYSNLFDDAAMPFMQRLTWSGVALHAGVLPGHPASAGCVRLPIGFAERLFERSKLGMRVIVVRDDVSPVGFAHPVLFKPQPAETVLAPDAAGEGASKVTRVAGTAAGPAPSLRRARAWVSGPRRPPRSRPPPRLRKRRRRYGWLPGAPPSMPAGHKGVRRAEGAQARAEWQLPQAEQWAGAKGASERAQGPRPPRRRD